MFIKNIEDYGFKNELAIIECNRLLWKTFHHLKSILCEDEEEDLKQDIILSVLEADRDYDIAKGASFGTYLSYKLQGINNDFLTKYTGIKINNKTKYTYEKKTGKKIYINKTTLVDE